jgi:hypothetical protein
MKDRRQNHHLRRLIDGYDDQTLEELWDALDPIETAEYERAETLTRALAALERWEASPGRSEALDLAEASCALAEANARCSDPWPLWPTP